MKTYRTTLLTLITIFMLCTFISCSKKSTTIDEYKYGIIFSSISAKKSIISTYSSEGNHLSDNEINMGGLNLASFIRQGIKENNDIFFACPVIGNTSYNYILKLDTTTMESENIVSEDGITPTFFSVDNDFAYAGNSSLSETYLSKTNLNNNKVELFVKLDGQGILCVNDNINLYVISIVHDESDTKDSSAKLYILNKEDLSIINEKDIPNISYISDAKVGNEKLYAMVNRDGSDNLSNTLLEIDLKDLSINTIKLPISESMQLHLFDNSLYIVESDFHFNETKKRIAKLDLSSMDVSVFNTNNEHLSTIISGNKFVSCDGNDVYIYDIDNFQLLETFPIDTPNNMLFISIYD